MNVSPFSTFRVALPDRMNTLEKPNDQNETIARAELTCMADKTSEEYSELHRRFKFLKFSIINGKPLAAEKSLPNLQISRPLLIKAHGSSFVSEIEQPPKKQKSAPNYFLSVSTAPNWIDLERFHYWNSEKQQEDYFFSSISFLGIPDEFLYASTQDDVQYLLTQSPVSLLSYKPKENSRFPNHYLSEDYIEIYENHLMGKISAFFDLDYYKKTISRSTEGPTTTSQQGLIRKMQSLQINDDNSWKRDFMSQHASTNETLCDILFIQSGTTSLQDLLLALFILKIQYSDIRVSCCRGIQGKENKHEKTRVFLERLGIQSHPGFIHEKKMDDRKRNQPDYMKEVHLKALGYHQFVKGAQNRYKKIRKRKHPTPSNLKSAAKSLNQLRMQYIFAETECAKLEKRPLAKDCLKAVKASIHYFESRNEEKFKKQIQHLKSLM